MFIVPLLLISFTLSDSKSEYNIPLSPYSIAITDLENDCNSDIVFGHNYSSQINWGGSSILKSSGYGYFQLIDSLFVDNGYPNVNIGYFDNNDYPDVFSQHVIANPYTVYSGVIFNYGLYQFDSLMSYIINFDYATNYLTSGNIDNNNFDDIVFASYQEKKWGILYTNGQNTFSEPIYYSLSYNPTDIESGQLNDDNYFDIVIGGSNLNIIFSQGTTFQTLIFDTGVADIKIIDLDNDGDNDIIGFDNLYFGTEVTFFENTGNSTFYQHENWEFTPGCYYLTVSDFNNDTLPDLFFHANSDNGMYLYYNIGGFEFDTPIFFPFTNYGEYSRISASADFDNNGFNDLVIVRSHGVQLPVGNVTILFNDGNGNFIEDPITGSKTPNPPAGEQAPNLLCYPNPFAIKTTISFTLEKRERVRVHIFDSNGQLIKTLINKEFPKGEHRLIWNGRDESDGIIKNGIYFAEIILNDYQHQVIKTIKN